MRELIASLTLLPLQPPAPNCYSWTQRRIDEEKRRRAMKLHREEAG